MSWDSYIDNLIAQAKDSSGTSHVDRGSIIGMDGGANWTTFSNPQYIKFLDKESANIARCFKSKDFTTFMTSGVVVEGIKYQFLKEEDKKIVFAKKKGEGALTIQCSITAIVVAHCPEGGQQGNCNKGVGVIAEYLETMGI